MSNIGQLGRRLSLGAVAMTFLVACLAHAAYVHAYGVGIPIWDEWVGEGYGLLKPWTEGHLTLASFMAPWNEHRIVFSRIASIVAFELSGGEWSVMNLQYFNASLYAFIPSLLMLVVMRAPVSRKAKLGTAIIILLTAVLPYAWENTLGAFQNQFYFTILSVLAASIIAANGKLCLSRAAILAIITALAIVTMAPGIVTGATAALVLLCRGWLGQLGWRRVLPTSAILLGISMAGYASTPVVAAHQAMHAASFVEFAHVFVRTMAWPATSPHAGFVVCWLPTAAATWMMLRRRWGTSADVVMLSLSAWTIIQAAGIALSRGHDFVAITPRYLDVLVLGIVANAWFAMRLASHPPAGILRGVPAFLLGLVIAQGFIVGTDESNRAMAERRSQLFMQQTHVNAYLRTGVPAELDQPVPAGSLPNPADMRLILDDPTMRKMLDARGQRNAPQVGSEHR
jgi:hypothetical protein